jgi:hypothetical protein
MWRLIMRGMWSWQRIWWRMLGIESGSLWKDGTEGPPHVSFHTRQLGESTYRRFHLDFNFGTLAFL